MIFSKKQLLNLKIRLRHLFFDLPTTKSLIVNSYSLFVILSLSLLNATNAATFSAQDRENIPEYIQDLCGSVFQNRLQQVVDQNEFYEHILDIPMEEGIGVFEVHMGCFFDQAIEERSEGMKQFFDPLFEQVGSEFRVPTIDRAINEELCIQEAQEMILVQNSYSDLPLTPSCSSKPPIGGLGSCEVSQAVQKELCALDLWAYAKSQEERIFLPDGEIIGLLEKSTLLLQRNQNLNRLLDLEHRVVTQALWDYYSWDLSYQKHLWMSLSYHNLYFLEQTFSRIRTALLTWPAKMNEGASYREN